METTAFSRPGRARPGESISEQIAAIEAELVRKASSTTIDLSNGAAASPVNGRAPAPPGGTRLVVIGPPRQILVREADCAGPLAVVHSSAGLDVALAEPRHRPAQPRGGYLIQACPGCEVQAQLEEMDGWTALALWHEAGCRELGRLLRQAGVCPS